MSYFAKSVPQSELMTVKQIGRLIKEHFADIQAEAHMIENKLFLKSNQLNQIFCLLFLYRQNH